MKGLTPGRKVALAAAIAALLAGVAIVITADTGGHSKHRRARSTPPQGAVGGGAAGGPGPAGAVPPARGARPDEETGGKVAPRTTTPGSGSTPRRTGAQARQGGGQVQVAARYLGVSPASVRRQLQAGHTLGQIAAAHPGKSAAGLIDALVAARTVAIHAAIAEGRISKRVEGRRLARVREAITVLVQDGRSGGLAVVAAVRDAAAYLGADIGTVREQLARGRTLAQIANATPGHSAKGLLDALVAARRAALDRAVAAGRMNKARERALLAHYRARVAERLNTRAG